MFEAFWELFRESDWLMVIITLIYTVTTIYISLLNYRTLKIATQQYHSDIQLKLMPCLHIEQANQNDGIDKRITINTATSYSDLISGNFSFSIRNVGNGVAKNVQYVLPQDVKNGINYIIVSLPCQDKRDFVLEVFHSKSSFEYKDYLISEMEITYKDLFDCVYSQTFTLVVRRSADNINLETFYLTAPKCIRNIYQEKSRKRPGWLEILRRFFINIYQDIRRKHYRK